MSLDFKLHYDRLREGDPTKSGDELDMNEEGSFYEMPGHVRNLCLIWTDGKCQFLSYAYLVGGEFLPNNDINIITLDFSTYIVTLKGYGLEQLFKSFSDHKPKEIRQVDSRYVQALGKVQGSIVEIIALKKPS